MHGGENLDDLLPFLQEVTGTSTAGRSHSANFTPGRRPDHFKPELAKPPLFRGPSERWVVVAFLRLGRRVVQFC